MDFKRLADLLFQEELKTPEEYEALYPPRELPEGAKVTRIAPSPTGFIHIGNLFGAITDERIAHLSGGIFMLRIEDTDMKREVAGAVEMLTEVFELFGLKIDEGVTSEGDKGCYGPYRQRAREKIYKSFAKRLVEKGLAYPCFCTEEDLDNMRKLQEERKDNPGYYGAYAKHRDMPLEDVEKELKSGKSFVLRFRSTGDPSKNIVFTDMIKGKLEFPDSDQDFVLLKSDGIPTYHFAHAVDDHLMRTSVVVRGEEWLSTLPWHLQLFAALGFRLPKFAHTASMMKLDGGGKRKLSKRKDPEAGLEYFLRSGYPVESVKEYLMTVLNSNYEEWRAKNPSAELNSFPFSFKKMGISGSLYDVDKLRDVSKNTIAVMDAQHVYSLLTAWAEKYDPDFHKLISRDPEYTKKILAIGRGGKKPRKDIAIWSEVKSYMDFFFDELFIPDYGINGISADDIRLILDKYDNYYDENADMNTWFDSVCRLSADIGFAPSTKEYKAAPDSFRGHPGDVSMVLRVAVCGRQNSPDLYSVMSIMGKERVLARLAAMRAVI